MSQGVPSLGGTPTLTSRPDGVWVSSGALEAQEPFGAKQKPRQGKHGDRTLRLGRLLAQSSLHYFHYPR